MFLILSVLISCLPASAAVAPVGLHPMTAFALKSPTVLAVTREMMEALPVSILFKDPYPGLDELTRIAAYRPVDGLAPVSAPIVAGAQSVLALIANPQQIADHAAMLEHGFGDFYIKRLRAGIFRLDYYSESEPALRQLLREVSERYFFDGVPGDSGHLLFPAITRVPGHEILRVDRLARQRVGLHRGISDDASWHEIQERVDPQEARRLYLALHLGLFPGASWDEINARLELAR